jgi:hypothetical protein
MVDGMGVARSSIVLTLVAFAFLAAPANASTFCVPAHSAACTGTDEPTIQDALQAASQNDSPDSTKDTVRVAPGTYHGPFVDSGGNPVALIGSGDATVLDDPSGGPSSTTASFAEPQSTASSFRVLPAPGGPQTALSGAAKFSGVTVSEGSGNTGVTGVHLLGTFDAGRVTLSDPSSIGVVDGGSLTRSHITAGLTGVSTDFAGSASDDLIRVTASNGTAVSVLASFIGAGFDARQLTLIGPGAASGATGVATQGSVGFSFNFGAGASAALDGVLIRGFGTDLDATGQHSDSCGPSFNQPCTGLAGIDVRYSDFDPLKTSHNAYGSVTSGPGNISADPRFVEPAAGNFDLRQGSPVVDRGDPQAPAQPDPPTDVAGRPRKADGNGDGTAAVDMGAFERQPAPPVAVIRGPSRGTAGQALRYDATHSHDPEGGTLSYAWAFGDGASATSSRPAHTYRQAGTYRVRLSVTSSSGAASGATEARIVVRPPCVVPSLRGKTLAAGRRALSRAHCRLGRVVRRRSARVRRGRIISSDPGRHRRLRSGAKVAVVLSR